MVDIFVDEFSERLGVDLAYLAADVGETVVAGQLTTRDRAAVLLSQNIEGVTALKGERSTVIAP